METPDPSHRSHGSDFFICFAPRRASRSHRLRTSSSRKGAQSPAFFPSMSRSKKKSSTFEAAAEPSSPKVSCIGQVRVKTARRRKKKADFELRSRSQRAGSRKDSSFRRGEAKNQSWVHLPLGSFCEGIRAFGSDLNCFRSCRKGSSHPWSCSCSCSCGECGGKRRRKRARMCSCKSAFARCWVMELEEEEEEEGGDGERDVVMVVRERDSRRGMRELELLADELEKGKLKIPEEKEEEVPVCVPPKNALLLMRCRSDPVKMASLATRFVEADATAKLEIEEQEQECENVVEESNSKKFTTEIEEKDGNPLPPLPRKLVRKEVVEEEEKENKDVSQEETKKEVRKEGIEEERRKSFKKEGGLPRRSTSYKEGRRSSFSTEAEARRSSFEKEGRRRWSFSSEKDTKKGDGKAVAVASMEGKAVGEEEKKGELPDCLLLMMYEPKLSMEVSKETWVCKADFLQWQPHRRRQLQSQQNGDANGAQDQVTEEAKKPVIEAEKKPTIGATDTAHSSVTQQSLARVVSSSPQLETQKPASTGNFLVESTAYGPFALMRCKSEPARSSASGLLSLDGCFWRSRHQPVGEAGVGF